jgi:hypothetical protein
MAERARDRNTTNLFRFSPHRRVTKSITAVSAIALGVVSFTVIFQRFLHREFIGDRTRLVHLCKNDPQANPRACSEILSSRSEAVKRREKSLAGALESARFNLADTQDADLIPPPDLLR